MDIGTCVGCGAEDEKLNEDGFCAVCANDPESESDEDDDDLDEEGDDDFEDDEES